jgi:hypothetical protein
MVALNNYINPAFIRRLYQPWIEFFNDLNSNDTRGQQLCCYIFLSEAMLVHEHSTLKLMINQLSAQKDKNRPFTLIWIFLKEHKSFVLNEKFHTSLIMTRNTVLYCSKNLKMLSDGKKNNLIITGTVQTESSKCFLKIRLNCEKCLYYFYWMKY